MNMRKTIDDVLTAVMAVFLTWWTVIDHSVFAAFVLGAFVFHYFDLWMERREKRGTHTTDDS